MKKEYSVVSDCSIILLKDYLYQWIKDENMLKDIVLMMNKQEIIDYVLLHRDDVYKMAMDCLYSCQDFDTLEEGLVVMNTLFNHQEYLDVKADLYNKLIQRPICVETYLVLRHLKSFHHIFELLRFIYEELRISLEEYAKICIIENEYDEALRCLKQLDVCPDELLDVVASYSLWDYYWLKKQCHMSHRLELDFVH